MSYILKQKFNISDLVEVSQEGKHILLVEPEYYTRQMYSKHLSDQGFVALCADNFESCRPLMNAKNLSLLVLSPHAALNFNIFLKLLHEIRSDYQSIPILTVGRSVPSEVIFKIMGLGVVSHLEKNLTRPQDIVAVVKMILQN